MYYHKREITPELEGIYRFNKADESVSRYTSREVEVRALVEGQLIAKRVHSENLGFNTGEFQILMVNLIDLCYI